LNFLSCAWLFTLGDSSMDPRKRQTSTATPAEPGGLPLTLARLDDRRVLETVRRIARAPNWR
jgi:hypothetical protein